MLIPIAAGYEEEAVPPENYYANNGYAHDGYSDDGYSPSPPHASGGSYYPASANFPPPPTPSSTAFTHPDQASPLAHEFPAGQAPPSAPIPPYNPADYASQPAAVPNAFGQVPQQQRGDNVSQINAPTC